MGETKLLGKASVSDEPGEGFAAAVESAEILGALKGSLRLSEGLNGHAFREFARWLKEKRYLQLGFKTEVEFLASDKSPLTKNEFYNRKSVFAKEGEELFDLLNAVEVPLSTRKLIGQADDIRIDGKHLVVGEAKVRRDDWDGIVRAFKTIAAKADEQDRTIKRGRQENKVLKKKLEAEKAQPALDSLSNPFFNALLNVTGAFSLLVAEAEKLTPEERVAVRENVFETMGQQTLRVDQALGLEVPEGVKRGRSKRE